jgi:hypothetical protein
MFEKQFMTDVREKYIERDIFVDVPDKSLPFSRWTEASDDDRLMNHLLRMFWTWDNIVERAMYRPIFEEDVATMDPASAENNPGSFCSRFLVNALLALSCVSKAIHLPPSDITSDFLSSYTLWTSIPSKIRKTLPPGDDTGRMRLRLC